MSVEGFICPDCGSTQTVGRIECQYKCGAVLSMIKGNGHVLLAELNQLEWEAFNERARQDREVPGSEAGPGCDQAGDR